MSKKVGYEDYRPMKNGDRFTIGYYWNESEENPIINDGICGYYWWDTEKEAQEAADSLNEFECGTGLGPNCNGTCACDDELYNLYRLFNEIYLCSVDCDCGYDPKCESDHDCEKCIPCKFQ